MKIKAVVFDMDGLMFDTERLNFKILKKVVKQNKVKVPTDFFRYYREECIGNRMDVIKAKLTTKLDGGVDINQLAQSLYSYRANYLKTHTIKKKKGLLVLLQFLRQNNIRTAIASSSKSEYIRQFLANTGVAESFFDKIVGGERVVTPKPHPQIYQIACDELGVLAEEAIALEDSQYGIESAHRANMKPILIPDISSNKATRHLAFAVVRSLKDVIKVIKTVNCN